MSKPKLIFEYEPVVTIRTCNGRDKRYTTHYAEYECECGNMFTAEIYKVNKGSTASCGCLRSKCSSSRIKLINIAAEIDKLYLSLIKYAELITV